jgi:hypothetical protein
MSWGSVFIVDKFFFVMISKNKIDFDVLNSMVKVWYKSEQLLQRYEHFEEIHDFEKGEKQSRFK